MKKRKIRHLTEEQRIFLKERSQRLAHLLIQSECPVRFHRGRKYIVVRSMADDPEPGASNMIDMTEEIETFLWTGKPSASEIVATAINRSEQEDARL